MNRIFEAKKIEEKSFSIIDKYLKNLNLSPKEKNVAARVIHASADPRFGKSMVFQKKAVEAGLKALKKGANIITDAGMVEAGINKKALSGLGGRTFCFLHDPEIAKKAVELKTTKAVLAMRKAAGLMEGNIVAIGNAPTALFELCSLIREGKAKPALVIGMPVGFVGAGESKRELRSVNVSSISNKGRRGGSSAACAAVNALLLMAAK